MKYLKLFENFDQNFEQLSNNVKQIEVNVSDDKIKYYMNKKIV